LGDKKGIWPVKASASKPLGMLVNVCVWGIVQTTLWVTLTCLYQEERYGEFSAWTLRIRMTTD